MEKTLISYSDDDDDDDDDSYADPSPQGDMRDRHYLYSIYASIYSKLLLS